jgi:hypothetical protein
MYINLGPIYYENTRLINEIKDWCTEQFGLGTIYYDHVFEKPGYRWYNIRVGEICMIKIKHEDDVTLFRLRWGHL